MLLLLLNRWLGVVEVRGGELKFGVSSAVLLARSSTLSTVKNIDRN
jgi:hypothetical protein